MRCEKCRGEHCSSEKNMLEDIKAVFLDIDGTLTNSKHEITQEVKDSIKRLRKKGIYVILCSGRNNKDVCKYSKKVCASEYAISSNGAQIYNYKKNENFYKNDIQYNEISKVWNYCKEYNLELVFNTVDYQFGNNVFCSDIYKDRKVLKDVQDIKDKEVYQIIINSNDYYNMKKCNEFINKNEELKIANYSRDYLKNEINSKEPYYIFINDNSVDKGTAIKYFLKVMNLKKKDTVCFGDRINDLTMFNSCGKTVAMDNADDSLKEIANYITLSNDENGVAYFLNKYIE